MGMSLANFKILFGNSTKELQQFQNAGREVGLTFEETASTVQASIKRMGEYLTKGYPSGLGAVHNLGIDFDVDKAKTDWVYEILQLQQFAIKALKSGVSRPLIEQILESFGISNPKFQAGLISGIYTPENLSKGNILNESQIEQLRRTDVLLSRLGDKVKNLFAQFTASHGEQLVGDFTKIADQFFRMATALVKVAEQLKVFQLLGEAFQGWAIILEEIDTLLEKRAKQKEAQKNESRFSFFGEKYPFEKLGAPFLNSATPTISPLNQGKNQGSIQNIDINQNLNFAHEGRQYHLITDSVNKAVYTASQQFFTRTQGA